ncbi:MAG: hypothetical protein A2845_01545 [Candidatus Lloydbacteria bacterium RIFCSPHIGHO2_01_FULL_49_22]|uniref:RNA polymerase sigma factor n=1 Tax=Candidatus Lloydbacteria bacterium RIFCSPHIGHO2_01_FULL_49_22 TaxID=1798658 RepID=A0A1G2CZI7_9BACT|nr:MAG: hypothetical protein A2845_01545 [Candidatus Lloydbacteria bacterium RIFCSPHIGHO2_01_FULL_49_22]OGZ09981.1 MAG: hypothetical protein A3C14_04710 [Candidatus Lloydbacteria bacterium RIFCSPHIGHO2_02_FULL_50_18]
MDENEKLSDEAIVEKVRSTDRDLYAILIERYQHKLLRYVTHLIKDEHMATDVVQEAFINAYINLNGFDVKKKFSSWIYRIAHNVALNIIKKYPSEVPLLDTADFVSDEDIEKEFEQKETVEMVTKCLEQIPLLYAEPLTLYYIEEKSYAEISDILRIPMGTVATRVSRAKALMKHLCQKN